VVFAFDPDAPLPVPEQSDADINAKPPVDRHAVDDSFGSSRLRADHLDGHALLVRTSSRKRKVEAARRRSRT
jgi:hypothetical protein